MATATRSETAAKRRIVLKKSALDRSRRSHVPLDRVRAGERWIDGSLLQRALDLKISGRAGYADALDTITRRDRAIAELVSRGMRNRAIAEKPGITEGTVKVYLHIIYEKLGIANRTELAVRVRQARDATPYARQILTLDIYRPVNGAPSGLLPFSTQPDLSVRAEGAFVPRLRFDGSWGPSHHVDGCEVTRALLGAVLAVKWG